MEDKRIQFTERMVGANHPTRPDTLNRLALVGHNTDGTHKSMVDVKEYGATGDGTTSDQTAVAVAVAAAHAAGRHCYWPTGTYLTTATIPNFHDVRHFGPGVVKRGTDLFYITQTDSQTNKIYLATTGDSANDGLTSSEPLATFQQVFDILNKWATLTPLPGLWEIVGAAGTYTISGGSHNYYAASKNRVTIKGPTTGHPNVPTLIVDGGSSGSNYAHGLNFSGHGVYITVKDIKFQNFSGDPGAATRGGLLLDNGADCYAVNIHADNCSWFGVYYSRKSAGRHSGGIINACRNGVLLDGAQVTLGYNASSTAQAPLISNCTESGVYWSRGAHGHSDYVRYEDNTVGLVIGECSRVDAVGSDFKRNTVGVRSQTGGQFGNNPTTPCVFNIGTADANITSVEYKAYTGESNESRFAKSYLNVATDRTTHSLSGTTPTVLSTPFTIKAGRLQGTGKACLVKVFGAFTRATAGSTVTVNFGGMAFSLTIPGAATNATFIMEVELCELTGGYRAFGSIAHGLNQQRIGNLSTGFNNSIDQAVSIAATLADAGDSMNIYRTDVYLMG